MNFCVEHKCPKHTTHFSQQLKHPTTLELYRHICENLTGRGRGLGPDHSTSLPVTFM